MQPAEKPIDNPKTDNDELVADLLRDFEYLATKRGIWEKHWEEVSKLVLPYYSTSFYSQGNTTPGVQRHQDQFDVTANTALFRFGAAMESMLTPRNGKWHRLKATDPDLMKIRRVQLWFDQVNDLLFHYRYAPTANYHSQQHDGYIGIGAFGTSCIFTDPLATGKGLRYRNIHLGELFFAENHQGIVDTVYRRFKMTLRQIVQKWGEQALDDALKAKLKVKPEEEVTMLHIVKPRATYDNSALTPKKFAFASYYVVKDIKKLVSESGYRTMPYSTARYITAPGELYGRSPAMNVLPAIRVLNEEKKLLLKQGNRAIDPVLLAHDDGILGGLTLKSGAVNYGAVTAEGKPLVHTLPTGDFQIGKELMDDERMAINDTFLVTLFQILVDTPQMTATEVLERAREKGALLSPTMGRFQSEGIGPMIQREFDVLVQQGCIPPAPPEVIEAGAQYKIEYDAPLNRAMRSEEAAGGLRSLQFAAEIAAQMQDPSILDVFAMDTMLPEVADIYGTPFRWIADPETIAAKRQQRNQAQTGATVAQALPGAAAMVKALQPTNQTAA
jgi:hypothetical protein